MNVKGRLWSRVKHDEIKNELGKEIYIKWNQKGELRVKIVDNGSIIYEVDESNSHSWNELYDVVRGWLIQSDLKEVNELKEFNMIVNGKINMFFEFDEHDGEYGIYHKGGVKLYLEVGR